MNSGFADRRVRPLRHVATVRRSGLRRMLAAPRGFEPRFTDPKSAVLPLDEGAAPRPGQRNGAEDGTRTRDPHLGKVMLYQLSHFRPFVVRPPTGGAESQIRTGDTAIFSRVLYQLSYLGPMANQALAARRRREGYHAVRRPSKRGTAGPGPAVCHMPPGSIKRWMRRHEARNQAVRSGCRTGHT